MRRALCLLVLLASAALAGCGEEEPAARPAVPAAERFAERLEGAPPDLAALHRQSNELLTGGLDAYRARLRDLRGRPVVVNKWASWCGPCRAEFPHFRNQALKRGKDVAFLGVDSNDDRAGAARFLAKNPVPYPSYVDPEGNIAQVALKAVVFPATAFYDRRGELSFLKQGGYATERELAADIERYAR